MRITNSQANLLSELDAALSEAVDTLYARALRSIETNGREPGPTPAEAEAYVTDAVNAAALRLGISAETIAAADRHAAEVTGWRDAPAHR